MKLGMPVIVVQVSRLNDPPQPGFLQFKRPFMHKSTLHRGRRGEGRCLNLTSYCVSVPRVLTRVVEDNTSYSSLETFASISKLV